jgi:hypothetical protein
MSEDSRPTDFQLPLRRTIKTAAGGRALPEDVYHALWMDRVRRKVVVNERGCWVWQGRRTSNGYGQIGYRNRTAILHRVVYEVHNRVKLGRWEYACHSCDTKLCCNPNHLWKGTPKDNQVDCVMKRRNSELNVTHCPQGHPYDEQNTYVKPAASGRPSRGCKACGRIRQRIKAGWTPEQAAQLPVTPHGHRVVRRKSA